MALFKDSSPLPNPSSFSEHHFRYQILHMQFFTVASLFSLVTVAFAQHSALPEEQNVAFVEDAPEVGSKHSSSAGSFDLDDFLGKLMADLPKKGKKDVGEGQKRPKFDFAKVLDGLMGDLKKGGDKNKNTDLKDLIGDLKGLDIKSLLDGLLKKPEGETEKVEI